MALAARDRGDRDRGDRERDRDRDLDRGREHERENRERERERERLERERERERERDGMMVGITGPGVHGPSPGSAVVPATSQGAFPDELDIHNVPPEYKREGTDWCAVFNPKVKRVLDVQLVHNLVHQSVVCGVRFSSDGKYLATGCNRTAQIYDTKTDAKTCVLTDETAGKAGDLYIRSVCFSPDGKLLATGAEDKQIRIWDISKKRIVRVFDGYQQEIYSLDFALRLIVSGIIPSPRPRNIYYESCHINVKGLKVAATKVEGIKVSLLEGTEAIFNVLLMNYDEYTVLNEEEYIYNMTLKLNSDLRVQKKEATAMVGGWASMQVHSGLDKAHQLAAKVGSHGEFAPFSTRNNRESTVAVVNFDSQIHFCVGLIVVKEGIFLGSLLRA
ncbi:hypothetical protein M378DRAFT_18069 [Amanita muscaria Koide BX008]|uniref:Uncharacterized protein n=1 Tax=Amanita muscaria (strain Koide BX008) TaxID=946122 RepID=A0A0C2WGP9_AMAMK|nr:hypothetical protein M378DRAFT_18069 [Amanita muscaria Koide BX008]